MSPIEDGTQYAHPMLLTWFAELSRKFQCLNATLGTLPNYKRLLAENHPLTEQSPKLL